MTEICIGYLNIETDEINSQASHSSDGAESCRIHLPTRGPSHSFIPTTQATESGAIDLISRWAREKPAALSLSTMM